MTLTDVVEVDRPECLVKSPDTKAAIAYLVASNATAITIIENTTGCSFTVGTKISARAAMVFWLRKDEAMAVLKAARRGAGKSPDITTAETALHRAASDLKVTLSDHRVAIERAGAMAARLDAYISSLKGTGALAELNKQYRRRRMAAQLRGEGFMSFGNAMLRFKRALIPILSASGATVAPQSLFSQIFDQK